MSITTTCTDQQGFTLIEVIMAMFVMTIGIFSLMSLQISTIRGNTSANAQTQAAFSGGAVIELLKTKGFNNAVFDLGASHDAATELPEVVIPVGTQSISWIVTDHPTVLNNKDVIVTVTFANSRNQTFHFTKGTL